MENDLKSVVLAQTGSAIEPIQSDDSIDLDLLSQVELQITIDKSS